MELPDAVIERELEPIKAELADAKRHLAKTRAELFVRRTPLGRFTRERLARMVKKMLLGVPEKVPGLEQEEFVANGRLSPFDADIVHLRIQKSGRTTIEAGRFVFVLSEEGGLPKLKSMGGGAPSRLGEQQKILEKLARRLKIPPYDRSWAQRLARRIRARQGFSRA